MADVYSKLTRFCAFRDRCSFEVAQKLHTFHLPASGEKKILKQLQEEGFFDDNRFARMFVRGKFHGNKWGKHRIMQELRARKIDEAIISLSLQEISPDEYETMLRGLIRKKMAEIKSEKSVQNREKIINFAFRKGFEPDLILRIMDETG